jgi:hypothetical protein
VNIKGKVAVSAYICPALMCLSQRHAITDIALESTIYEEEQQVQKGEDDGSNANEILQQVITSGILEWNPQGSFIAKHIANDSLDINQDRRKELTGIDDMSNAQLKDHLIHCKTWCQHR